MQHNTIPATSPWGTVQHGEALADGIIVVGTASHGGIWISTERLAEMPEALRLGDQQWFEEDCEAALVLVAFGEVIGLDEGRKELVLGTVANYYPGTWETFMGKALEPGQSRERDREQFVAANVDNWVTTAAYRSWHEHVPAGSMGVVARRARDDAEAFFLVKEDNYETKGSFTYVVDEAVAESWVGPNGPLAAVGA